MPKPESALLDPTRYPYFCEIAPRFSDLDVNLHINNVAIAGMLEDARVRFHRESGYRDGLEGLASMIVSLGIEYLGQGYYPDSITVYCAVEDTGRTSHRMLQLVMQGGRIVAFCRSVLVTMGKNGPAAIPKSFTDQIEQWKMR